MSLRNEAPYGMAAMGAFSLPGPRTARPAAPTGRPLPAEAHVAGIDATLDPSGALYWEAQETLVVSDLHLETGSSYARRGQMLPPYDSAITLSRLAEVCRHYRPHRIIALGDSFHDPFGAERIAGEERAFLSSLCAAHDVVWITGNHDRGSPEALGGAAHETYLLAGVFFRHIPTAGRPDGPEVAGHLHPAATIEVRGRAIRRRAFIGCHHRLVMPAFGALTGGLDFSAPAFAPLWPALARPQIHMIGKRRVYCV